MVCQEERSTLRTSLEYRPRFDGTRDQPNPKPREVDGHFIPKLADLEETECSSTEIRVVLEAGLDNVKKHLRQKFGWQTVDGGT